MIWIVTFDASAHRVLRVPIVAKNTSEAVDKARRMIPFVAETWKPLYHSIHRGYSWRYDEMLRDLEKVLEDLCDYLVKGGPECRPDFLVGIEHYIEARNAVCKALDASQGE